MTRRNWRQTLKPKKKRLTITEKYVTKLKLLLDNFRGYYHDEFTEKDKDYRDDRNCNRITGDAGKADKGRNEYSPHQYVARK